MKTKRKTMIALVIIIMVLTAVSCGKDPESRRRAAAAQLRHGQ